MMRKLALRTPVVRKPVVTVSIKPFLLKAVLALLLCTMGSWLGKVPAPVRADAVQAVSEQIENTRKGIGTSLDRIASAPPGQVLAELHKYKRDADKRVRMEAVGLAIVVTSGHKRQDVQRQDVQRQAARLILDVALGDKEDSVREWAWDRLVKFFARDSFTNAMKQKMHRALQEKDLSGSLVLLAGIAEVRTATGRLKELAAAGSWSAHLALARMGDPAEIQFVVDHVESAQDEVRRVTTLLDSLAYIRQPKAMQVISKYLFSEGSTPASPPDVGSGPFALYAARALEQMIEGFPSTLAEGDTVALTRKWVIARGANLTIKR